MAVKCIFCGREKQTPPQNKNELIVLGGDDDSVAICGKCIKDAHEIISEVRLENEEIATDSEAINPRYLKKKLDEWIIDQDLAKKRLAIAVYDHYKRINQKKDVDDAAEKSNILLVGSTGSGKTAIVRALSKQLNLPLLIEDVTTITTTGFQGRNVEDILSGLLSITDGNLELAQQGIVLLDEGDKLRKGSSNNSSGRDVKGEGVQQGLLKITEGGIFNVTYGRKTYKFDTSNVLFILAGAFDGIEKIISKRLNSKNKTTSGFTGNVVKKEDTAYNETIMNVNPEDLKEYGMMPELLGRFPIITPLQELSEDALVKILTEPKNAIVKQMIRTFREDNVELKFSTGALKTIAKKAKLRKTGARALRSIIEEVIEDAKYDCPGSNIKKVIVEDDLTLSYTEN